MGYMNDSKAIRDHVDEEDKRFGVQFVTPKGIRQATVINESGLYALILSSKLDSARRFKRWVTSEVLPAIRFNELLRNLRILHKVGGQWILYTPYLNKGYV